MKYKVLGGFDNAGDGVYCEDLLAETSTHAEAVKVAEIQKGAWDKVIIRVDDNPDRDEYI